ncbi:MAG: hypothetical protein DME35_04025 [Verrucomicrobia bacterium]|nr:MAG: hypothetical protein DME35_04025 [Verrucomicrobiota bacterium]PYL27708.1 MAG: hypothetical protein DMF45_11465 [Verrucomicrobiota bacterium]
MNQESRKAGTRKDQTGFTKFSRITDPSDFLSSNHVNSVDSVRIYFSWIPVFLISLLSFLAPASRVSAGDAVAIGYNANGVWTDVTYHRSATPKGGKDYRTSAQAREFALRDVRRRSESSVAKASILSSSDSTGFVSVARGQDKSGKDVNVVGRAKSQAEADRKAFDLLNQTGAGAKQKIVYRYFSYGADSK